MRRLHTLMSLSVVVSAVLVSDAFAQMDLSRPFTMAEKPITPQAATAVYDPATGNLSVNSDIPITTWEVQSAGSKFIPENVREGAMTNDFDLIKEAKWFKLDPAGFTNIDFGPIYPPNMDADSDGNGSADIWDDLLVQGSLLEGGALNREVASSPHLYIVPEPSGLALLAIGLLCVRKMALRGRRQALPDC